jgi:hypothetical protein
LFDRRNTVRGPKKYSAEVYYLLHYDGCDEGIGGNGLTLSDPFRTSGTDLGITLADNPGGPDKILAPISCPALIFYIML